MENLVGPLKYHVSGAFPKYVELPILFTAFSSLGPEAVKYILQKEGWLSPENKPTKKAARFGLLAKAEGKYLWKVDTVKKELENLGNTAERKPLNQDLPPLPSDGEPRWANLETLGTYFSVSSKVVGQWLDELELRDEEGQASQDAVSDGLATFFEMATGQGKRTRKITQWNLHLILERLTANGHYLDFNFEKTLKGRGRNSDVSVETVDQVALRLAKEFIRLYKDPVEFRKLPELMDRESKFMQEKIETILKRPGFITTGEYKDYLAGR